jgi:hypothetical protein
VNMWSVYRCSHRVHTHTHTHTQERRCVCINANFEATHTAECEGFPPPTNKSTKAQYSYTLWFDKKGKITKMNKLWNDQWTMVALGWA